MAQVQTIRRRMKSVKNIQQITKAMEMVAASKLRRAQEATLASRTYAISAREALAQIKRATSTAATHVALSESKGAGRLAIVFTSDRGLAGAYNSNVLKALVRWLQEAEDHAQVIVIGERGAQFVRRLPSAIDMIGVYTNWPHAVSLHDVSPIAQTAMEKFTEGAIGSVTMIYTDFISMARQNVVTKTLLPIDVAGEVVDSATEFLIEPSPQELVDYIVPRLVTVQLYQAALEAAASEHVMRMMAMKNASDNAHDVLDDLTLEFNGVRQAAITQELAEISAGAQAII